nr:DUF975 family protein [Lachnospiraceae bacterium]
MNYLKSSSALKADAKENLLGKYQTAVLAYVLMDLIVSGCLTLIELTVNLQTVSGMIIYYAAYIIISLLSTIFVVGQNYLYLNINRGLAYRTGDIWIGFGTCADRALFAYLRVLLKSVLCAVPCAVAAAIMIVTKNYYLSLLVAVCAVFMLVTVTIIQLDYSQVLYLVLDYPDESAAELLAHSKRLMKGHRGSYFYLLVSFLGIFMLGLMTFGLGMLWIYPYFTATKTCYYLELIKTEDNKTE